MNNKTKLEMKNIMIISPFLPWPLRSGGNTGVYYMLEYVGKYENVYFVTSFDKRYNNYKFLEKLKEKLPYVHFLMYDYRNTKYKLYEYVRKIFRHLGAKVKFGESSCSMNTLNFLSGITPGFIEFVNKELAINNIDIVQIEFLGLHSLVYALPNNVKKILIHHELGWVRNELAYGNDIYSIFYKRYAKMQEISTLNEFDKVVALTEVDKQKLKDAGVVSDLSVSTLAISNQTLAKRQHHFHNRLTFVGGSGHFPNFDGIKWFVSEVMPIISQRCPDIVLDIIGSWSNEAKNSVLAFSNKVNFLGYVNDLGEGLQDSIMVVPIRIGSGMRMKILEAANYSVPFVSTVVGAEGLAFVDGVDCFIAQSASQMAEKILTLVEQKDIFEKYSQEVHNSFCSNYSIETLGEKRLGLYK